MNVQQVDGGVVVRESHFIKWQKDHFWPVGLTSGTSNVVTYELNNCFSSWTVISGLRYAYINHSDWLHSSFPGIFLKNILNISLFFCPFDIGL